MAYSLLGIFDVNMPPLYGEGMKAFMRLQEEMTRHTKDPTFLYWEPEDPRSREVSKGRLLARSPAEFARILEVNLPRTPRPMRFSLTNIDLDAEGILVRWAPLTYALVFAESATGIPDPQYFCSAMLLRKHVGSDEMYRIGVCTFGRAYGRRVTS
jgi:hypothetical protein